MNIKNVIFDVGNVLADFRYTEYMRDLGFPEDVIDILTKKVILSGIWDHFDRGEMEEEEVFQLMKKQVPGYERYVDAFFDYKTLPNVVETYDYAEEWVKSVKEKGYRVYILSNYPSRLFDLHEKTIFSFLKYADGKVVSSKVKMIKPEAQIYQYLLDTYNLKPEECIFFDDREVNIEGAKKLGFNAYIFKNYNEASKMIP